MLSYYTLLYNEMLKELRPEEIRYMASQLETALGGVYSLLSQEFQLPLVQLLMKRMSKAKRNSSIT